jgi:DoxX-like family
MNTASLLQNSSFESSAPKAVSQTAKRERSRAVLWTGRIMSYLPAAFLLLDAVMKFVKPAEVIKGTVELGYPVSSLTAMGVALLASTLLYLIPRTAFLGAILLTGYLGGAVATHVRVENPLFTHTLFPVYFGILLWGGLWLRDQRLQAFLPFRKN